MSEIVINKDNFNAEVLESAMPVFIDFWADWCAPCKMVAPIFEELAEEYEGRIKFCKLDVDEQSELAIANGVSSIPAMLLFCDGIETGRIIGARPIEDFIDFLEQKLDDDENEKEDENE